MARIALLSFPQFGHLIPQLPIVAELVRRGHEVAVFNEPRFKGLIEPTGAEFVPYPVVMSADELTDALNRNDLVFWLYLWLTSTSRLIGPSLAHLRRKRPDIVLFDGLSPWGEIAATWLRVPSVSISTAFIFTVMDAPENKVAMVWRFAVSTLRLLPGFTMAWLRMAWYAGARALPWRMPFVPRQGTITMFLTSREMHPPTPLLKNPRFVFVGPAIDPALRPEKFDFSRLDGRPLIYVSLGTVLFTNRAFFDSCIEAFADFPGQVLLSVGPGTDLARFADAPANFIFAGSVPQLEILPRTTVFITHAGLNSIQEALWFGVPMVAVPHTPEQARNARIAGEFGAAVVLGEESFGREVTAPELRAAVDRVIGDPAYPLAAVALGKTLHAAGGFAAAADRIEALLAR